MTRLDHPTVAIFAKAPVEGMVKTRLARSIGAPAATGWYRTMLATTAARLAGDPAWQAVLAVTPDNTAAIDTLWPPGLARYPQGEGDLGARMRAWLDRATQAAPVLVVGSDIPGLAARHIATAFAALRARPGCLVFGPAEDGGFWLVGADAPPPRDIFRAVRWSGPHALSDSLANCAARPAVLVERLRDVDDEAGYRAAGL